MGNDKYPTETGLMTLDRHQLESDNARLESLIAANQEILEQKRNSHLEIESLEKEIMKRPVSSAMAYSVFGAVFGFLPTVVILGRIFFEKGRIPEAWPLISTLILASTLVTSLAGFLTGSLASKAVDKIFKKNLLTILLVLPLIGASWGFVSGMTGGVFLFFIGAVPGAVIGAVGAAVALPLFAAIHHNLQKDGHVELKHLLPTVLGISLSAAAFVLGL